MLTFGQDFIISHRQAETIIDQLANKRTTAIGLR